MKNRIAGMVSVCFLLGLSSGLHAEESIWEKAKKGASDAVEWTGEKAEQGWDATEDGREDAAEKGKEGWKETKEGASSFFDKLTD